MAAATVSTIRIRTRPTAPKNSSAALRSNGCRKALSQRARPPLPGGRERDDLGLAVAAHQALRAVAVEHGGQVVVEARAGERGGGDVGERGDRAVADLLLELPAGLGIEDRRDDRHVRFEVAHEQCDAQRPGVVARDDEDRVGGGRERVPQALVVGVLEPYDLGPGGVQRLGGLVGEVPVADEEDATGVHAATNVVHAPAP